MKHHFAVCINNQNYEASLELRKIYEQLPDPDAQAHGQVRVIDESGEDYLYPDNFFIQLQVPQSVEDVLAKVA